MKQEQAKPESFYQTGNTDTKKSHTGLFAGLIVAVILLVGAVSVMGLLNVQLFKRVLELSPEDPIFQVTRIFENDPTQPAETEAAPAFSEAPLQISLVQAPEAVANIPREGGISLQEIYEKNIPSIVSITTSGGNGSGMVISECGYILTNHQVLAGNHTAQILFHDGTQLTGRLVGTDSVSDLAILDVEADGLIPVAFGSDAQLQTGDPVFAIGDPLGLPLRGTMIDGFISAINRDLEIDGRSLQLLQTNTALYDGYSGGPLLNCYGQVIGINTVKAGERLRKAGINGLGFAIPSSTVKEVVDQLLRQGYVSGRPGLGFELETVSAFDQLYYRVPAGLFITSVDQSRLPLLPGDILLRFDGQRVGDIDTLQQLLIQYNAGDTVPIVIYRSGEQHDLNLTLTEEKS